MACSPLLYLAVLATWSGAAGTEVYSAGVESSLQKELDAFALHLDNIALETKEKKHVMEERSTRHRRDMNIHDPSTLSTMRHGFVPNTEVGNREAVEITGFQYMPSRKVRHTVTFWEYFEYKRKDFLVTYIVEESMVHVLHFNISIDPFGGPARLTEFLTTVANVSTPAEHGCIFGLPRRTQPIEQYEVMFIGLYTKTEMELYTFSEIGNTAKYMLQHNQTISLKDVTDSAAFIMDTDLYMILARGNNQTYDGWVKSIIYKWNVKRSQFEVHQILKTHYAQSVVSMEMMGKHYIVFAEKENLTSVWKYDQRQLQFKPYIKLFPSGCVEVEQFSLGFHHFLILTAANRSQASILRWSGFRYENLQVVHQEDINSWRAIKTPNCQDGVLLTLSYGYPNNTFQLFTFDYLDFKFKAQNNTGHFINGTSYAFRASDRRLFAGVSGRDFSNWVKLFEIYYVSTDVPDPILVQSKKLQRSHLSIMEALTVINSSMGEAEQLLAKSVRLSGDHIISGTKIFRKVSVNGSVITNVITAGGNNILYGRGPEGVNTLSYLEQNLTQHESEIEVVNATLNASVTLDTYQDVYGIKTFLNTTTNHSLTTANLETDTIDGVWLEELVNTSVWLNREGQAVSGSLRFTETVQVADVIVDGYVNGVDLSEEAVTDNTIQTVAGEKQFQEDTLITGDMVFDDGITLDDIDVSEEVVTLEGNHTLTGVITFTDSVHVSGDIITSQTVDGVQVSALAQNILFIEGNQTLQEPITFTNTPEFQDDIDLQGTVNGVDLSDLSSQAVRRNQDETISGEKTFTSDLSVDGDVQVSGLVDGVDLAEILTSEGSQTVTGVKYFAGGLTADNIEVSGSVDGIDLSSEVVTFTGDHTIGGVKNLTSGAHFDVDIVTSGLVDGVDVSELTLSVLTRSGNQTIRGPLTFDGDTTFEDSLDVDGLINGVNITFLEEDVVYSDLDEDQTISALKTFSGNVTIPSGSLEANGLFNSYNVSSDFLDIYRNQTVTGGNKTFADGFKVDADVALLDLIDGWTTGDLGYLLVSYLSDTNITGLKTIIGNGNLNKAMDDILGEVNGVDVSEELMTVNKEQNVTGDKIFNTLQVREDLQVTNLIVQNNVNDRNWKNFLDNRVTLSTNQSLSGYLNFTDTAHITGDVEVAGLVNGFNITKLAENTMSRSKPQTVTGQKNINGQISSSGDITFLGLVDGVNISDWIDNAMRLTGDQTVKGAKVFVDPLSVDSSMVVSGLVNTVNVTFMEEDAVMKDSSDEQVITADKIFEDGVGLDSNLTVHSLINGVNISDAVTLSGEQTILGSWNFTEGMTVVGNVTVSGLINDVNVTFIDREALRLNREEDVNTHKVFEDVIYITSDVQVTELSDTVDVSELTANALKVNEQFEITGDIYANNTITFLGDLDLVGTGDGEDLGDWAARVVLLHTDQDITDTKIFSGSVTSDNPVTVNGTLEIVEAFGVNIFSWSEDIVYRAENTTITGSKVFEDDIHVEGDILVDGTVDGIDISEEVVTLSGEQTILGTKKFTASVNTTEDVAVTGFVNGFYLPDLEGDTFMLHSPMNVTGSKTFAEDLFVDGSVTLSGTINGSPYEEPVTLYGDYTITGHWIFDTNTTFVNDLRVEGLTSSLNLTEIADHRVTLSGDDQVVEGPLVFTGDVVFQSDVSYGPINGIDLLALEEYWQSFLEQTDDKILKLDYLSSKICEAIDGLQETYAGALSDFDYFEKVQDISDQTQSMTAFQYNDALFLAVAVYAEGHVYTCVQSSVYEWVDYSKEFIAIDSILTNGAMKFEAFRIDRWQFLAVANAGIFPCDGDDRVYSSIFIFNTSFVHYQDLPISAVDVEAYVIENTTYLVFAGDGNTIDIYTHNIGFNQFEAFQSIQMASGAYAIEFLEAGGRSLLVVAENSLETASVFIIEESGNLTLHQTITSKYAYDITSFLMGGQVYVVFAGYTTMSEVWGITEDTESLVYYWSEDMLHLASFDIPFRRASDVSFVTLGFHSYLILVEQYKKVELFRYEGSGHFVSSFMMPINGVKSVEAFTIGYDIYLAISIDPLIDSNPSMIVRAVLQGHLYEVSENLCDFTFGATVYHDEDDLCDLGTDWGVGLDGDYMTALMLNKTLVG